MDVPMFGEWLQAHVRGALDHIEMIHENLFHLS
jgi:hypothetical protein